MHRRSFFARAAATVPLLSVLVAARRPKDMTFVSVMHDGDKPVELAVTGDIILMPAGIKYYDRGAPLRISTPAEFYVNVEQHPTVITPKDNELIRVKADRQLSNQHLYARARRVTIRKHDAPALPNVVARIEIVGESTVPK